MNYERGLKHLGGLIPSVEAERWSEFQLARGQLLENIQKERLFGGTETLRNERSQVVYKLNLLALKVADVSFVDLCVDGVPSASFSEGGSRKENTTVTDPPRTIFSNTSADGASFTYGHALLIGVGQYQEKRLTVPSTANDAKQLGSLLVNPGIGAYPPDQVTVITNTNATRSQILESLDRFGEQLALAKERSVNKGLTAVVFFAGHGGVHQGRYFLHPNDFDRQNAEETSISAEEFHARIHTIRNHAAKTLVLLNCCHAGGIGEKVLGQELETLGISPTHDFILPLGQGKGQVVISSSRPDQLSGACSQLSPELSVFGARLCAALQGGAVSIDYNIKIFDLFSYLALHVPQDAQNTIYNGLPLQQTPLFYSREVDTNFAVALSPAANTTNTLSSIRPHVVSRLIHLEAKLAQYRQRQTEFSELILEREKLLNLLTE